MVLMLRLNLCDKENHDMLWEDSCTIIEVDSIFMGIWEFMGMWDNRGKRFLHFLSDHPNSCSPNAAALME